MKCRRIEDGNVVWFGSIGINSDGTAKFYSSDKHDNYSDEKEAVKDSLIQRLSVIKSELWYDVNTGVPLFDKIISKAEMDADIMTIIMRHDDVINIDNFESSMSGHNYSASMSIETTYGDIELSI